MTELPRILIIDDDALYVQGLSETLAEVGYKVFTVSKLDTGIKIISENKILVVLLGLSQGREEALENLKSLKIYLPFLEVIILAHKGNFKIACRSMTLGAYDFLVKSPNITEIIPIIDRAHRQARKNYRKKSLRGEENWPVIKPAAIDFIGQSTAIKHVLYLINKVAPTNSSVLISGETGVGKELIARLIHQNSTRCKMPFITINCGAIPEALLENEFFGHTKGAFTDSVDTKYGLLEDANGGTLFLDEVTELSPALQVKLLRVVETGTFRRLGDNHERWTDIRIISATNRSVSQEIKSGRFRNDLFYRLAIFPLYIQPLRVRHDDIPLLIDHFLESSPKTQGKNRKKFSDRAIQMLLEYDWPGNVRELKNFIERVTILSENKVITPADVAMSIPSLEDYQLLWEELETARPGTLDPQSLVPLKEAEKKYIQYILKAVNNDLVQASQILKISHQALTNKITDYELVPDGLSTGGELSFT